MSDFVYDPYGNRYIIGIYLLRAASEESLNMKGGEDTVSSDR